MAAILLHYITFGVYALEFCRNMYIENIVNINISDSCSF